MMMHTIRQHRAKRRAERLARAHHGYGFAVTEQDGRFFVTSYEAALSSLDLPGVALRYVSGVYVPRRFSQ